MHESVRHLRLDRRLLRRRDWLSSKELEEELGSLPDVSEKAQSPEERRGRPSPEEASQEPSES